MYNIFIPTWTELYRSGWSTVSHMPLYLDIEYYALHYIKLHIQLL